MATILLSVKPKYIEKIFNGTKKYEFRKKLAKLDVSKIILYSTSPCKYTSSARSPFKLFSPNWVVSLMITVCNLSPK